MKHDWILDVLADLKVFAQENGLATLAEQLDDAELVAANEISSMQVGEPSTAAGNAGKAGSLHRTYGAGKNTG